MNILDETTNHGLPRYDISMVIAYQALVGGVFIGSAATLLLVCSGRIAGISGIINGVYSSTSFERMWRLLFLFSLLTTAAEAFKFFPQSQPHRLSFPIVLLVLAGLLVGFGTRMGNGCTSGHGVCGLGRLSVRSFVAVLVFMSVAVLTVTVNRHLGRFL